MRLKKRIPVFLRLLDFDKLENRWGIEFDRELRDKLKSNSFMELWELVPDQRFGQFLINRMLVRDNSTVWFDEEYSILKDQGLPEREYMFWGRSFDKNMNRLSKTEYILIKDLTTNHVKAIIKFPGVSAKVKRFFINELKFRKNEPGIR